MLSVSEYLRYSQIFFLSHWTKLWKQSKVNLAYVAGNQKNHFLWRWKCQWVNFIAISDKKSTLCSLTTVSTLLCLVCLLIHLPTPRTLYSVQFHLLLKILMRTTFSVNTSLTFSNQNSLFSFCVQKTVSFINMVFVTSCFRHYSVWVHSPESGIQTPLE